DGFVEEKEFRVESGRHHLPSAPLEIQEANDPTLTVERADDLAAVIVQRPSTISHEGSTRGGGENPSVGVDAVLQRHPDPKAPVLPMISWHLHLPDRDGQDRPCYH